MSKKFMILAVAMTAGTVVAGIAMAGCPTAGIVCQPLGICGSLQAVFFGSGAALCNAVVMPMMLH